MRKLVVYFSYSGHTRSIANMIKDKLRCDVLELVPLQEYSSDYQKVVDEEEVSQSKDKIIGLKKFDVNLADYDEIICGGPIWWYLISPAMRTFLKENDLSGKVVKPFVTSAGWLGDASNEVSELCPTADKLMHIQFKSYSDDLVTSLEDIDSWINSL